jgi:hypothetical protein
MSDAPQGPDWWQASDDKWYPPPRPQMPGDPDPVAAAPASAPGFPPPGATPDGPPAGPPAGPPLGPPPTGGYGPSGPPLPSYGGPPSGGFPTGPGAPGGPPPGMPGAPGMGPSPYGTPPRPPGAGNRTPLFVALAVIVAAVVVAAIVIVANQGDDKADPPTTTDKPTDTKVSVPTIPETTAATSDTGDDGGGSESSGQLSALKVIDSGFTSFPNSDFVSGTYGIVIKNNGTDAVTNFTVNVAVYDKNDTVIGSDPHTVAKIGPGEEFGIGYDVTDKAPNGIGKLDVSFEKGFGSNVPEGAFTVSNVAIKTDQFATDVTYTVASSYQTDLRDLESYAIFRDANHKIVGGAFGTLQLVPKGGRANGDLQSFEPLPGAVTANVYVDKGFF